MKSSARLYSKVHVPTKFTLKSVVSKSSPQGIQVASTTALQELRKSVNTDFRKLGLRQEVANSFKSMNFQRPSDIQLLAIPQILSRSHVLCAAETGSGKTAAYLAPVISNLRQEEEDGLVRLPNRPRVVIFAPSQELVRQITSVAKQFSHESKVRVEPVFDRIPSMKRNYTGTYDIIVAPPKKFKFYVDRNFSLSEVQYVIFDEADSMMEKEFGIISRQWMKTFREKSSKDVQFIFASATIPKNLYDSLTNEFGQQLKIVATPALHKNAPGLNQRFLRVRGHGSNKQQTLLNILKELPPKDHPTMIFCNTAGNCRALEAWLSSSPEALDLIGGRDKLKPIYRVIPKQLRRDSLEDFKNRNVSTLVCTDLASRGLDTTEAQHVILYDFPHSAADYLHRVGRTARNNSSGKATCFLARRNLPLAEKIQRAISKNEPIASIG